MNREQSIAELRKLVASQRLVEARNLCIALTEKHPLDIEIWRMRGNLHFQLNELDSVSECLQRILAQQLPGTSLPSIFVDAYKILGDAYLKAGRVADAINTYERLIAVEPNDASVHAYAGICRLLMGDFQRGWPEYEWRLKTNQDCFPPPIMPRWNGQSLNGKKILIQAEQGHGDTVQFVRYVRNVKAQGGTVILACQSALHSLLAGCSDVDLIVSQGDLAPSYDVEIMLMSLPGIFQTTLETIPADVPYLRVPPGAGASAVAMTKRHTGVLRVGLVWASSPRQPVSLQCSLKSLKLEQFSDLFGIAGTKFFSLQKGEPAAELESMPSGLIADLGPHLGNFADTAAAIQALDIVISVDTAVAHVAGALARPVWTLLPFAPDWRWMLNRDDSPWYPTMRLFRQPESRDWSSVIARLASRLTTLVEERSTTPR